MEIARLGDDVAISGASLTANSVIGHTLPCRASAWLPQLPS